MCQKYKTFFLDDKYWNGYREAEEFQYRSIENNRIIYLLNNLFIYFFFKRRNSEENSVIRFTCEFCFVINLILKV